MHSFSRSNRIIIFLSKVQNTIQTGHLRAKSRQVCCFAAVSCAHRPPDTHVNGLAHKADRTITHSEVYPSREVNTCRRIHPVACAVIWRKNMMVERLCRSPKCPTCTSRREVRLCRRCAIISHDISRAAKQWGRSDFIPSGLPTSAVSARQHFADDASICQAIFDMARADLGID